MAEKQNLCPKMTNFFYNIYYPFFYKKFPFLGQFFCLFCLSFLPFFLPLFFPLFFFICIFPPFVYKIQFCFFIILFPQLIEKKIIEKKKEKRVKMIGRKAEFLPEESGPPRYIKEYIKKPKSP